MNKGHHPTITPDELPEFLQALNKHEFWMFMQTRIMLRLMMMMMMMMAFVPTSELTQTPWSEIDFKNGRTRPGSSSGIVFLQLEMAIRQ